MGHSLGYIANCCHRPSPYSPAMPELPEVETTRLGITPAILGQRVSGVEIRQPMLRWRIPDDLARHIVGKSINRVERRGKYLLLQAGTGWVIVHLGMSGSLRVLPSDAPASLHDHVDIVFGKQLLRLRDPRRFGAVLWQEGDAQQHSLLASLGPEPLSEAFTTEHLYQQTRQRRAAIKLVLMDHHMVVGVGNIYASESLFRAGIRPGTAAQRLSRARCARLVQAVKDTLRAALAAGGSTLRDFVGSDGAPGYFQQQTFVYDRDGLPCRVCSAPIRATRTGQRSTYYCRHCQK